MTRVLGLSGVRLVLAGMLALAVAACFVGRAEAASVFSSSLSRPAASGASVVVGDRALTLKWSAVKGAGAYRVSWRGRVLKGGKPTAAWSKKWLGLKVLKASARSHKAAGLVNGREYQLRLESKAKVKKSRWVVRSTSVASPKAVTPTPTPGGIPATTPGAPTSVLATSVGQGRVTVSWTAPASDGGSAIIGYTVRASGDSSQACATNGALSCTVAGLANGTAYTFTVVATSAIGNSGASAASGAVTPATCATGGVCVVGDSGPGGGTVFYAPGTAFTEVGTACFSSCRYLEVAPAPGWSSGGVDPEYQWGGGNGTVVGSCSNKIISGATGTAIGSGFANTAALITACPDTSGNGSAPAARAAWTYLPTVGGVSTPGWFLPSKDEAMELDASDVGGFVFGNDYWTSSQVGTPSFEANYAWYQWIGFLTYSLADHKQQSFHVRPIRAF